jgi:hypothetical protein
LYNEQNPGESNDPEYLFNKVMKDGITLLYTACKEAKLDIVIYFP